MVPKAIAPATEALAAFRLEPGEANKAARTHARAAKGQPPAQGGDTAVRFPAFGFHPLPKTQSPRFCCREQAIVLLLTPSVFVSASVARRACTI